jgi:hypothetical protein
MAPLETIWDSPCRSIRPVGDALIGGYTDSGNLPEGKHSFTARAFDGVSTSSFAADTLITVDTTGPTVLLAVDSSTASRAPIVEVSALDTFGLASSPTLTVDVDLNNDGDFTDAGETAFGSTTLSGGQARVALPLLPGLGTYRVRARIQDLAGNEGTSAVQTFTVTTATSPNVPVVQVAQPMPSTSSATPPKTARPSATR